MHIEVCEEQALSSLSGPIHRKRNDMAFKAAKVFPSQTQTPVGAIAPLVQFL